MKLLLDQNLSYRLVTALQAHFAGTAHVRDFGLQSAEDLDVWALAASQGFVIVSKDEDFHQRSFVYGAPPKVVWVKLGNCSTAQVRELLVSRRLEIESFVTNPDASFLVLG